MFKRIKLPIALDIPLLLVVAAATYLLLVNRLDYFRDDWYYVLDWHLGGPGIFIEAFSFDRPLRGYVFEALFNLFNTNPLPFHLTSALWRGLSGISSLWLFRILWPQKRQATFVAALLFTLFPGYLWGVAGIEYQPMVMSVLLQIVSIGLTLQAVRSKNLAGRIASTIGAILTGWAYIGLVDYAIGMEAFRFLCVYLLISQNEPEKPFLPKLVHSLRTWSVNALIPIGYLFWNIFLFSSLRPDTNIGTQLSVFANDPLHTAALWVVHWLQSIINVSILAWGVPFYHLGFSTKVKEIIGGLLLSSIILGVVLAYCKWGFLRRDSEENTAPRNRWEIQVFVIGGLGIILGVIPIILANRYVNLDSFSHYALPTSLASALLITGLVYLIKNLPIRMGLIGLLVFLAVFTHYSNAVHAADEEQIIRNFWWQISWRVPNMLPGTTLVVNYPSIDYGEGIDVIWGPANLIYHTDTSAVSRVHPIYALPLINDKIEGIWTGKANETIGGRNFTSYLNYNQILVISQPKISSCVHVMDKEWPRTTTADNPFVLLTSEYSDINNVDINSAFTTPPFFPFKSEPAKGWCYIYQQAELALQKQVWETIIDLSRTAEQNNLRPNDPIEWLPFIQAYTHIGEVEKINGLATIIKEDAYAAKITCENLTNMANLDLIPSTDVKQHVLEKFCTD